MKIQSRAFNAGGIKTVHVVDFGTSKQVRFEVWEYDNGYMSFPSMHERGGLKFTPVARQAVISAIQSNVVTA